MMQTNLSQRLRDVARFVPKGARLLDVGSDHAYLPIFLLEEGIISFAIAGEVVKGPYDSACSNVLESSFSDKISVRLANGLAAFQEEDQINVITICGMGGRLIANILSAGLEKLKTVPRLILQANNREDELRYWLTQHGFKIVAEQIMTENGKYYEIIVAEHGQSLLSSDDIRFGPFLKKEKSLIFREKWQRELEKIEEAYSRIPEHHDDDRSAMFKRITAIKEAIDVS